MFLFYTNPILIAAAVLPAIFLLVHVYRADKLEKEPAPLLISLVLYGIAATFIALVFPAPPPDVAFRRVQLPV